MRNESEMKSETEHNACQEILQFLSSLHFEIGLVTLSIGMERMSILFEQIYKFFFLPILNDNLDKCLEPWAWINMMFKNHFVFFFILKYEFCE